MPSSDRDGAAGRTPRLLDRAGGGIRDRRGRVGLPDLRSRTSLSGDGPSIAGASVLVATGGQMAAAIALVELDGVARRLTIAPPDLDPAALPAILEDAEIDRIVTDDPARFASMPIASTAVSRSLAPCDAPARTIDTEWVMMTSGTSGRPKLVAHTLAALTGAIDGSSSASSHPVWSTFYDIRRYGGLQIFLRALASSDLVLTERDEPLVEQLRRLGDAGVRAISGTPSHWRRVLMSHERSTFSPSYIRLSGEIADQAVLDGLRDAFPDASIAHAYASTEAGVGFAVDDGREGFPATLVDRPGRDVTMVVKDGSLRIKSNRAASRYLGLAASRLADIDGFVDTGDLVERRGDRYHFVGRRGGIINIGGLKVNPEEVEAAINAHADVRMSLVKGRRSPLTGALVTAEVVPREPGAGTEGLRLDILETCRRTLERHKVPVTIQFVDKLALTAGGKLSRGGG